MVSWGSPGMDCCASPGLLQCPTAMARFLPKCGFAESWAPLLSRMNEGCSHGEAGKNLAHRQMWPMPHHLGLCPLFVYNYSHRKMRNCSQFLSKNMGNHWLSTTYLDPLYFIFLLHLPILHYHLCNLEECRDQFKIHWKSLWLSVVAPGSGPGGINC